MARTQRTTTSCSDFDRKAAATNRVQDALGCTAATCPHGLQPRGLPTRRQHPTSTGVLLAVSTSVSIAHEPSRFRPTHRVEIFDRFQEGLQGCPVKIAEVSSDGIQGRIRILDERFRGLIEGLFSLGSLVMEREAPEPRIETYSLDGIRQVIDHELGVHDLYAAVEGLE